MMSAALPDGTVTFLFTDIEGSTKLWEAHPDQMRVALARHDAIVRQAVMRAGGHVFKTVGDAFCAAFSEPAMALQAATEAQLSLHTESWPTDTPIHVRMAINTGAVEVRDGDYFGPPLNRVARLLSVAYGGQVLVSGETASLTSSVNLLSLGEHRLKDLSQPIVVFQLVHPELDEVFPPLRSLDNFANNLPPQVTSFVGRRREVDEVKWHLTAHRLVTLTGTGGVGKTRLSLKVAEEVLEEYRDGAWFIELAGLDEPGTIAQTVSAALGIKEANGKAPLENLTTYLADRRLLLVLDNCEHLIEPAAKLAQAILRSAPNVQILASSRERIGVSGEYTYRVPSLSLPDPQQIGGMDELSEFESIRLFVDRANAATQSFRPTDQNARALVSVCNRLDGIPFAIELAAARVRSLSVEDIDRRLDQRFRLLTGGSRTALPHQQTLQSLVAWSYDLLNDRERRLLARLAVFSGGWTIEAAEHVCSDEAIEEWEVLDLLTSLFDKSLVMADLGGEVTRYRLLETVRQFALERLYESPDEEAVRRRHVIYFIQFAEKALGAMKGSDQAEWLRRVDLDYDNLRVAHHQAEALGALRLVKALNRYWYMRGRTSEARDWTANALNKADAASHPLDRAWALKALGVIECMAGDFAAARPILEEALGLARGLDDPGFLAATLSNLAYVAHEQVDYAKAQAYNEECLVIFRALDDKGAIATTLNNLGRIPGDQGDYTAARPYYEESLVLYRQIGDRHGAAIALHNLSLAAKFEGNYERAEALERESLAIRRELDDKLGVAISLQSLGDLSDMTDSPNEAEEHYLESLRLFLELGVRDYLARVLEGLGAVRASKDALGAARLWGAAEAIRKAINAPQAPHEREHLLPIQAKTRAAVGEGPFSAAWAEGRYMSPEELVADLHVETKIQKATVL